MRFEVPLETALGPMRMRAVEEINARVDQLRRRYITSIAGQEAIYLRKEAEARAYLAAEAPELADYKWLAAEVGITAPTAYELAQIWLNKAHIWAELVGPQIEGLRQASIAAVQAAASGPAIEAALAAAVTALEAL
jgi:hypothetical protein